MKERSDTGLLRIQRQAESNDGTMAHSSAVRQSEASKRHLKGLGHLKGLVELGSNHSQSLLPIQEVWSRVENLHFQKVSGARCVPIILVSWKLR